MSDVADSLQLDAVGSKTEGKGQYIQ